MSRTQEADIELGSPQNLHSPPVTHRRTYSRIRRTIQATFQSQKTILAGSAKRRNAKPARQSILKHPSTTSSNAFLPHVVEDNPSGYPRFAALIASHDHFHICRRFTELRSRLLLIKQDKLSDLERQLRRVDEQETDSLRLATCRDDDNAERIALISKIDHALSEYGTYVTNIAHMQRILRKRAQTIWSQGTSRCCDSKPRDRTPSPVCKTGRRATRAWRARKPRISSAARTCSAWRVRTTWS
jgi:hypothetical protein